MNDEITHLSPLEIGLVVHYAYCLEDHPWVDSGAPIRDKTLEKLIRLKLIERQMSETSTALFKGTKRAELYVKLLQRVELPLEKTIWIDPSTNEVLE